MADFARSTDPDVQAQLDRLSKLSPARRPPRAGADLGACSTGSAVRRTRCRRCFTSPAPTAKARPVAFLRAALEASGHKRPRLHQPAPRPLQRAHSDRRPADRRRRARRHRSTRSARRRRRTSSRASSKSRPPPHSSRSRERPPTPASSRSGSAAGSTRPTSSSARWSRGIAKLGARPSAVPRQRPAGHRGRESRHRQAGRAARHATLSARGREQDRRDRARARARSGCRAAAPGTRSGGKASSVTGTGWASSTCRCRACRAGTRR